MPDDDAVNCGHLNEGSGANNRFAVVRGVSSQTKSLTELHRRSQELEHRLKNVLCNVLALVSQAKRDATVDVDVIDTLSSRIKALSGAQLTIVPEDRRRVELGSLIASVLSDVYGGDRFSLHGASLTLSARAGAAMNSVFHELATNAAKYGALSQDGGRIELNWTLSDVNGRKMLNFEWKEMGGPQYFGVPAIGFGSQLITSTVTGYLKGGITRVWRPGGLSVEMVVPVDAISHVESGGETAIF